MKESLMKKHSRILLIAGFSSICCASIIYIFSYSFLFSKVMHTPYWAQGLSFEPIHLLMLCLIPAIWFPRSMVEYFCTLWAVVLLSPIPVLVKYFMQSYLSADSLGLYNALINTCFNYFFVIIVALVFPIVVLTIPKALWGLFLIRADLCPAKSAGS